MRIALDLPDDLLKQAKMTAVERRSTLSELVVVALRRELTAPRERGARPAFPTIELPADAPILRMTPAGLKVAFADEEEEHDARLVG